MDYYLSRRHLFLGSTEGDSNRSSLARLIVEWESRPRTHVPCWLSALSSPLSLWTGLSRTRSVSPLPPHWPQPICNTLKSYLLARALRTASVQFSHSVVSNSLQPHGLQHSRLPCPSPPPGACSNSSLTNQWCHPTISFLCQPLLLLPSIFSSIRVFSNEPVLCIRWPKYWSFSFSPSNEYSGLISFRMDWI